MDKNWAELQIPLSSLILSMKCGITNSAQLSTVINERRWELNSAERRDLAAELQG
jgi:hypothetical protein